MQTDKFASRHLGPKEEEITKMLNTLEVDSVEVYVSHLYWLSLVVLFQYLTTALTVCAACQSR